MRQNLKSLSVILWLVIAAFILSVFVTWGMQGSYGGGSGEMGRDVVALVDGEPIDFKEFQHALNNQRNLYQSLYKDRYQEMIQNLDLEQSVLDSLVDQKVALNKARSLGLGVTPEEIQQRILEMPAFQQDGRFIGQDLYRQILEMNNISVQTFEKMVGDEIVFNRFSDLVTDAVMVSEADVRAEYMKQNQKAAIDYVFFEHSNFKDRVKITDEALSVWYDEHQEDYREAEKREIRFIVVDARQVQDRVELTDDDIEYYYNDNRDTEFYTPDQVKASHILLKTNSEMSEEEKAERRQRAEELLAEARGGADFAALAAANSEDSSASRGGDLGFFGEGAMVKPFSDAAFSLAPGEISEVVESPFGFHIIMLVEKKPAGYQPLDEVREQIERRLKMEYARDEVPEVAAELNGRLEQGETLDDLSGPEGQAFTIREATIGYEDNIPFVGRNPEFADAVFGMTEPGTVAGPVTLPQGAAIISLVSVIEPRVPDLEEKRKEVEETYRIERAKELARTGAEELHALASGSTLAEAAAGREDEWLKVKSSEPIKRNGYIDGVGSTRPLDTALFNLEPGQLGEVTSLPNGELVYAVTELITPDEESFQLEKANTRTQLESSKRQLLLSSSIAELRKHQDITLNPVYFDK
jgi:peptidyl-prolyl cis-trans isomerase D